MHRSIAIVGAPSSIGIRPYDSGEPRHLDRAPGVLRELGLVQRLGASDLGDVIPPAYRDYVRPAGPGEERSRSRRLLPDARRAGGGGNQRRPFCSRAGRRLQHRAWDAFWVRGQSAQGSVGLVYFDAHADFGTPEESHTGSVASMCLALAVGRGETPLARLAGDAPLVHGKDVVLIGRRDAAEPWYGHAALAASPILDISGAALSDRGVADVAAAALLSLTSPGSSEEPRGFWIHLDADVINPTVMPAVDSPTPGGPTIEELVDLLTPLVRHPTSPRP